jgi:glycosyltransferase involved in cell wall biosynthesis
LDVFFVKRRAQKTDKDLQRARFSNMHVLIDASGLRAAAHEAKTYFRGMVRHLLLAPGWHEYSFVGWPQAQLGGLASYLAPLSRIANTKLIAMPAAGEPTVVYSPVGFPTAGRELLRFLTRGAPIVTVGTSLSEGALRPARGIDRWIASSRASIEAGTRRWGLDASRATFVPPGIESHDASALTASAAVSLPDIEYVAAAGLGAGFSACGVRSLWRILAAFRAFRRSTGASVRLAIVGGAPLAVRAAARAAGLADRVDFLPAQERDGAFERSRVIASAAAFVHASRPDSSWLSAVEAMHHGVPVVAPRTRATREVFGDVALYYPDGSVTGLAGELGRLFDSDELRRGLARHGMLRGQAFSWEASARQVLGLFDEIAATGAFAGRRVGGAAGCGYNRALPSNAHVRLRELE